MMFSRKPTAKSTTYYYSPHNKIFEKSLDVYKPIVAADNADLPVVVLVVGSGWVGHRSFVYSLTSWWNSSGPNTIASLGCTCVCIRHRGAFCVLPNAMTEFLVVLWAVLGVATGGQWDVAVGGTCFVAFVFALLALGGRGSASMEDMWDDVAEALCWIENNPEKLQLHEETTKSDLVAAPIPLTYNRGETSSPSISKCETFESQDSSTAHSSSDSEPDSHSSPETAPCQPKLSSDNNNQRTPIVFGGYSSGGHVATTLLQQTHLFQKHGLPAPEELFQGVLMISGMMAVRPGSITVEDKTGNGKRFTIGTPNGAPRWLTDLVVCTVWGSQRALEIPSPLMMHSPPRLPHLMLGCRNEVFGLNWLDVFFCSREYTELVGARTGNYSKYVEVESDHWNVLNSKALWGALHTELPALVGAARQKR